MLSGVLENSSFLVDKLNAGFPPGTERLNGSIRDMLLDRTEAADSLERLLHFIVGELIGLNAGEVN
jgi:hypothetical protein